MMWRSSPRLTASVLTALVWALLAGSAVFWAMRMGGAPLVNAPVAGGPAGAAPVDAHLVARMLGAPDGAAPAAPAANITSRLALRGIVTYEGRGAALIAVDGKPPKPVRVGATLPGVEGGWAVQSLTPRTVVLAAGDQQAQLSMPLMSERSTANDGKTAGDPGAPSVNRAVPPPPATAVQPTAPPPAPPAR